MTELKKLVEDENVRKTYLAEIYGKCESRQFSEEELETDDYYNEDV